MDAPIPESHVPQTEGLQIGDHRLSTSCAVVERPTIVVMTLFELFSWLQKRFRPPDLDTMTNTALEAKLVERQ